MDREVEYNGKPVSYWVGKVLAGFKPAETVDTYTAFTRAASIKARRKSQCLFSFSRRAFCTLRG